MRGGLYKETGRIARLRNSSKLILEGDSYLYGSIDCDETSLVINKTRNIQSRKRIINNTVFDDEVIIAHYEVYAQDTNKWIELTQNKVVQPTDRGSLYQVHRYNGRLFTSGKCKLPTGNINLIGKTIALRIISPTPYTSTRRSYPLTFNEGISNQSVTYSQGISTSLENTSIFYAPGEVNLSVVERGERFIFIPCPNEGYTLQNIVINGNSSFLISDIYVIDRDAAQITGNEELRILEAMSRTDE